MSFHDFIKPFNQHQWVSVSVTRLDDLLDFGNFLKPLAIINFPKSPTLLGNFCKGVKIYHFSSETFQATFVDIWRFFSGHTGVSIASHCHTRWSTQELMPPLLTTYFCTNFPYKLNFSQAYSFLNGSFPASFSLMFVFFNS